MLNHTGGLGSIYTAPQTGQQTNLSIPPRPEFFSPMSAEERNIQAQWDATYGGLQAAQNTSTGGATSVQGTSTSPSPATSPIGSIPPRPQYFSPMSTAEANEVAAWDAQYGGAANTNVQHAAATTPTTTTTGSPTTPPSFPRQAPSTSGWAFDFGADRAKRVAHNSSHTTGAGYPQAGGDGGYNGGGGYQSPGGANSGSGNRPLYDYTYYRYGNEGSQHLDQVNQQQGTGAEWNTLKNAWGKPTL